MSPENAFEDAALKGEIPRKFGLALEIGRHSSP
jgi:hypothetical protein